MKIRTKKGLAVLLGMLLLLMVAAAPALAHKMDILVEEEGYVTVRYADGRFSTRTEVVIYDADGQVLTSGKLDEQGGFDYSAYPEMTRITADDGLGHQAEWIAGTSQEEHSEGELARIIMVLTGFAGTALFFTWRSQKKRKK